MNRREFLTRSSVATLASSLLSINLFSTESRAATLQNPARIKNIIFLVSDGMSQGTLNMADLLKQRMAGKSSTWMRLYHENKVARALMDTASADSLVTDSAAGSSAWGGGVRVNNGSLNWNADASGNTPILVKFKRAGKSTGCVTTVPITHATPAGFCVSTPRRDSQEEIASLYLPLRFDVMMGGGTEFFSRESRSDRQDLFGTFKEKGFQVVRNRDEMFKSVHGKPILGVFHEDALPYALDHGNDENLKREIPTLAEMTQHAIHIMSANPKGFVLQVEGGKVDWGAHANDTAALLYDQLAFDEALEVAVEFASARKDTLVIVTTDHGNGNPGLIKCENVNAKFDTLQKFRHTNEWVLKGISVNSSPSQVIERIREAQGYSISQAEAGELIVQYLKPTETGLYNSNNLPFRKMAEIQQRYTAVGWAGMDHSSD